MRATVVHMIALSPDPVATFEDVGVYRISPSRYVPAVTARPVGGDAPQLILPMLVVDVTSEEDLDKVCEQLKEKLDQGFAEFKSRWRSARGKDEDSQSEDNLLS